MTGQPNSQLTAERPDVWIRGVALATSVTGLEYVHKAPLPDGAIYACGGGGWYTPPERTKEEKIIDRVIEIDRRIEQKKGQIDTLIEWQEDPESPEISEYKRTLERLKKNREDARIRKIPTSSLDETIASYEIGLPGKKEERRREIREEIDEYKRGISELEEERNGYNLSPVPVPDGAMEWLLHEVGHWVASTSTERQLPNYGYGIVKQKGWGKDREWQAWAFEEIIMAPFGPSRGFAPVEHRGGTAFDGAGWQGIPEQHLKHAYAQILASGISVEQWRALYREWVTWGTQRGVYSPL